MTDADTFDGDEAVALSIVFAAEDDATAIGTEASVASTIETSLPFRTNDRLVDATRPGIAAVFSAGVAVITTDRWTSAHAAATGIGASARVAVVTWTTLVCRRSKTGAVAGVACPDEALVVER